MADGEEVECEDQQGLKREMRMEDKVQKKRCLYICNISSASNITSLFPRLITPYNTICHTDVCLRFCSVPAMITSHPNTTMARKGQTKELNCTARGEQPIIIRWERGDTVIDAERNPRYSITINKKGDEVISTLKVRYRQQHLADVLSHKMSQTFFFYKEECWQNFTV